MNCNQGCIPATYQHLLNCQTGSSDLSCYSFHTKQSNIDIHNESQLRDILSYTAHSRLVRKHITSSTTKQLTYSTSNGQRLSTHTHAHPYPHIYVHTQMHTHVYVVTYTHTHMHRHTHAHTHIHTYT